MEEAGPPWQTEEARFIIHAFFPLTLLVFRHGRIDVVVNNAGIQPVASCVPMHVLEDRWWDQLLAVNLTGVYNVCKPVLVAMIEQHRAKVKQGLPRTGGGVIINMASVQGLLSQQGVPAYAATKGAMLSLTRQMAMDYGQYGIRGQ